MVKSSHPIVPVVIDTNVIVPSLYMQTHIMKFILDGNLVLIWNNFILEETLKIINKLSNYYAKSGKDLPTEDEVIELLSLILDEDCMVSDMPDDWEFVSSDRDDDPFLFAAEAGNAKYIISLDKRHMISLGSFRGIPIGTPSNFFTWAKEHYPFIAD